MRKESTVVIFKIRCATSSKIKLAAVTNAVDTVFTDLSRFEIVSHPVELQSREDMQVNAQPYGLEQTTEYALSRLTAMQAKYPGETFLDIAIESGVTFESQDVAVVVVQTNVAKRWIGVSAPVPVPEWALTAALNLGLETGITVGDVINERFPAIPATNWQDFLPPYLKRSDQIRETVEKLLMEVEFNW